MLLILIFSIACVYLLYCSMSYNIDTYIDLPISYQHKLRDIVIPNQIFQTHKDDKTISESIELTDCTNSWKKINGFKYFFYNDEQCDYFMKTNFDNKIYRAYQKCPYPVMKGDLWRYCILYQYGGIYVDADTRCLVKNATFFTSPRSYLVMTQDTNLNTFCQWAFAAPSKSPVLESIIQLVVSRLLSFDPKENYKITEKDIFYLTGPIAMKDGVDNYLKSINLPTCNRNLMYKNYKNHVIHCLEKYMFHRTLIKHYLTGKEKNGWKKLLG